MVDESEMDGTTNYARIYHTPNMRVLAFTEPKIRGMIGRTYMTDRKSNNNIDGFVLRRRETGRIALHETMQKAPEQSLPTPVDTMGEAALSPPKSVSRSDIDASLSTIDETPHTGLEEKPKKRLNKRLIKWLLIILLVVGLAVGGYFGFKVFVASGKVFDGNVFDLLGTGKELKADASGRTNVLIFGTSEDDPSHEEAAPDLADSILVLSLDQKQKTAAMFSVPRDLYVKYGQACNSGYEGKINEVYGCNADGGDERAGADAFKQLVGDQFGLDIQYYAHVNYTVLRETVDAVGGVTVNIESEDPRGILDRNFDWKCNYRCYYVKWPNGPAQLDGEHALALARARNAAGGYGLSRGNFDREQNQQKIIMALKDKAVSAGTLANPVAVSQLIDSLGNNVRTNFDAAEIKTLMGLVGEIKNESIKRIDLVADGEAVLTTGTTSSGMSIVRPKAGIYDFSAVRSYIQAKISSDPSTNESATIEVLNGTDTIGVAGKKAEELAKQGIVVGSTGDAPTSDAYGALVWYDQSGGEKPNTKKKLTEVLGEADSGATLPSGVQSDADFVIIVGNGSY